VPGIGADWGVLFLLNHLLRYVMAILSFLLRSAEVRTN
jgi:hypothetical protein